MGQQMLASQASLPDRKKARSDEEAAEDNNSNSNARFQCDILLSSLLKCERHHLYASMEAELDPETADRFMKLVERRLKHEPIQYLVGYREFMGLPIKVDKRVLIPRCDTETLVEYVIDYCKKMNQGGCAPVERPRIPEDSVIYEDQKNLEDEGFCKGQRILDLCTGSGAIAVSIAKYVPGSFVVAADISKDALSVAKQNAALNMVKNIKFIHSDLFDELDEGSVSDYGPFDVIVSNPPYIPGGAISDLMPEVRDYEPLIALDGGVDGLDFYRKIARFAPSYLKPGGLLAFEVGYDQAEKVAAILADSGQYSHAEIKKDLAGINRVVSAKIN